MEQGRFVIKDVPDFAVVVGNPARQIGWISEAGVMLDFSSADQVFCDKSDQWYFFENDIVKEKT